jgi:hypothetical protein
VTLYIGCDPGLTGAISLIDPSRGLLECADIPVCSNGQDTGSMKTWVDVVALDALLWDWSGRHDFASNAVVAGIERPIAMPNLPAQTIASQFDSFGALRGALAAQAGAAGLHIVSPHAWKKLFGLHADKTKARALCQCLYAGAPVTRVKDHNRAESILIAHYLVRTLH